MAPGNFCAKKGMRSSDVHDADLKQKVLTIESKAAVLMKSALASFGNTEPCWSGCRKRTLTVPRHKGTASVLSLSHNQTACPYCLQPATKPLSPD